MKKDDIIALIKDKRFIIGVVSACTVFLVGMLVANSLNYRNAPFRHQNRFVSNNHLANYQRGNHMRNPYYDDQINYQEYNTDNIDLNMGADAAKKDTDLTLNDMLTYAIQDEYLARAGYNYILDTFGSQRPFSNIVNAEEYHISLLTPLLTKYASIPTDNAKDVFPHPLTIEEALKVGVQAELDNIAMYESFLNKDIPDDVKVVFSELLNASQNHLQAFGRNIHKY